MKFCGVKVNVDGSTSMDEPRNWSMLCAKVAAAAAASTELSELLSSPPPLSVVDPGTSGNGMSMLLEPSE